ncbi:MAG: hypothetical protein QOH08_317 [Chloroflexota bacterium]|nr:hypothetical protein [Chloroflexota bacterium]
MFAFGTDGRLRHRWWEGTRWVDWEVVPDAPRGDAVSCAWSGTRLDVFVAKRGADLWYRAL